MITKTAMSQAEKAELVDRARTLHADDDLEIDDNAATSEAEDGSGTWVAAWVWVPAAASN